MSYKRLTPCIFIDHGKAVKWFDNDTVLSEDVVTLAKQYCDRGADELIVFDLSVSDEEHDEAIDLIKRINRVISIPMIAGGNIRRSEDVKKRRCPSGSAKSGSRYPSMILIRCSNSSI